MTLLLVALGAAVGAPMRYLVDRRIQTWHPSVFPWGTSLVNLSASLVLGLSTGAFIAGAAPQSLQLLVGTGFCGALSTYSTFSYETLRLFELGSSRAAALNVGISVIGSIGAAFAGAGIAHLIWA